MSLKLKTIIPFIDKNITEKDVSPCSGFIEAYRFDENRPNIRDCIFLVYDASMHSIEQFERLHKFKNFKSLRSTILYTIKGKKYTIYAFTITDKSLLLNLDNAVTFVHNPARVLQFWGVSDEHFVNNVVCPDKIIYPDNTYIPEKDFIPDLDDVRKMHKLRVAAS